MKNNMKLTSYYQSGQQVTNILLAREKATVQSQLNKQKRIYDYNTSPTLCKECTCALDYEHRKNKFCSNSCAALFNNKNRKPRSIESREKTSNALKGKLKPRRIIDNSKHVLFCRISWNQCPVCNTMFYSKGWGIPLKCCGKTECVVHLKVGNRPYKNGRRKIFYYFNKHQCKEVMLESTWEYELAKWLDTNNIKWIRPTYIKWFDSVKNKERLYYPDFYLPDIDLFLDPKNPTAMKIDAYKMSQVEKIIPIVYGNLDKIKQSIMSG